MFEMITRVLKVSIRTFIKMKVLEIRSPGAALHKKEIVGFLNNIFGNGSTTLGFWQSYVVPRMKDKFDVDLEVKMNDQSIVIEDFESLPGWKLTLLQKVSEACGFTWASYFYPEIQVNCFEFFDRKSPITPIDLINLSHQVRYINLAWNAKAYLLKTHIRADYQMPEQKNELLRRTIMLFRSALHSYTPDKYVLSQLGHLYQLMSNPTWAQIFFERARKIDPYYTDNKWKQIAIVG